MVGSNGGVPATRELVARANLVIFIGSWARSVFPAKGTRIVHIDSDPEVIGASYPTEVAVVSDARLALSTLWQLGPH